MKIFMATLLLSIISNTPSHRANKPEELPVDTFSHRYFQQLDKANAALRDFANTPCTAPEFNKAATTFSEASLLLQGMYKNIPLDEDDITEAHEVEAFIGFTSLANTTIQSQNTCVEEQNGPSNPDSKG